MSVQNIDITPKNISGKCDLKCAYNFKYLESNSTAKNNGVMISLSYENGSIPPVLFNNQKYIVSNIMLVSPSIHTFNGSQASAEIIIYHSPEIGGPQLNVAIPIISSSESSTASNLITEIIESVATNAPSKGNTTNLNLNGFTLQNIVPNKPFYSYTESDKNEWIVFGILFAIPLNSKTLKILSQIITPFPLPTIVGKLFLNSSGPNTTGMLGDGIYISCKPTGSSEEETTVEYSKNTPSYDFSNITNSPNAMLIIQIVIGCIIFIIVFALINYVYSFITKNVEKITIFSKKSN